MSQSSLSPTNPLGSSSPIPWPSDDSLGRITPGFRGVVDGLLIFLGGSLALIHFPTGSMLYDEIIANGIIVDQLNAYLVINLMLGLLGLVVAFYTVRSSFWKDRQRVLVCLSLVLAHYTVISLMGLLLLSYPDALSKLLLCIAATSATTIICIGLISVEKRLRSVVRGKGMPERVATKCQSFWRMFHGGLFGVLAIFCLMLPSFYFKGVLSGSFVEHFEKVYDCPISWFNYFCLLSLCLFENLYYLMAAIFSWHFLSDFHQQKMPSLREKMAPEYRPIYSAVLVCVAGSVIHIVLFAAFHPGPDVAPWILSATIFCAWFAYKRSAAKVAIELNQIELNQNATA